MQETLKIKGSSMDLDTYLELTELLVTKICHDLSGPLGAVNNGIELLRESQETFFEQSMDLIDMSANEGTKRLLFFRQAYGAANKQSGLASEDTQRISNDFFKLKKVNLQWDVDYLDQVYKEEKSRIVTKLVMSLMVVLADTLIVGGDMSIAAQKGATSKKAVIQLTATNPNGIKYNDLIELVLEKKNIQDKIAPDLRNCAIYYSKALAEQHRFSCKVSHNSERVSIVIS